MDSQELDNILNSCLERLAGGASIADCLKDYPEQAGELEPLLQTAALTRRALADIKPDPRFKTAARFRMAARLDAAGPPRRAIFSRTPRWALAAVASLLLVIAMGSGTVVAASGVMPDHFLYPVKLATEQVRLETATSDLALTELNAEFTDRRVEELIYVVEKGNGASIDDSLTRLDENLVLVASIPVTEGRVSLVSTPMEATTVVQEAAPTVAPTPIPTPVPAATPPAENGATFGGGDKGVTEETTTGISAALTSETALVIKLESYQASQLEKLHALLETAPPSARPAIEQSIRLLEESYRQAIRTWAGNTTSGDSGGSDNSSRPAGSGGSQNRGSAGTTTGNDNRGTSAATDTDPGIRC